MSAPGFGRRRAGGWRRPRGTPELSIVIVAYNMERELPRTLMSLSRSYQHGIERIDYEVLVVDNGSTPPVVESVFDGLDGSYRLVRADATPPSPAHAANVGLRAASGRHIALVLDGARMVTPGVVAAAVRALRAQPLTLATPIAFHLGPDHQSRSIASGYGPTAEDEALRSISWPDDGYRLFEICVLAGANPGGFAGPLTESCFLAAGRALWNAVGGLDERFDLPGGGLVSLDLFARMAAVPGMSVEVLVGEGSFHQVHGGASTAPGADHARWHEQYKELRGLAYSPPAVNLRHSGEPGELAARFA